jgi:hypothetical protein
MFCSTGTNSSSGTCSRNSHDTTARYVSRGRIGVVAAFASCNIGAIPGAACSTAHELMSMPRASNPAARACARNQPFAEPTSNTGAPGTTYRASTCTVTGQPGSSP